MELFQLEAFLAVVREGSFSAAAKALFRTQPAISQTIKKLEDEIGRPLFDRSSRRGVLTDAGRVLADHAERLVNLAPAHDGRPRRCASAADRPPDDGGQRADVSVPVTDSARVSAALSGSAHYGAARARQPRARRRCSTTAPTSASSRFVPTPSRSTRSSSITMSWRSWCRRRIRWRAARRCRSASSRASRSSRITCRRRIDRK